MKTKQQEMKNRQKKDDARRPTWRTALRLVGWLAVASNTFQGCAAPQKPATQAAPAPKTESPAEEAPATTTADSTAKPKVEDAIEEEEKELPTRAKPAPYERILGSFIVDPDLILLLDPVLCAAWCVEGRGSEEELRTLLEQFQTQNLTRAQAAAHLNLGALYWKGGDAEAAYREIRTAQALFSELADVEGIAHAFEWLGFLFKESHAIEQAAEHLGAAHKFYVFLGRDQDVERVLAYGD